MLQTRNAKRTGFAAVRAAVDMVNEGLITPEEALNPRRVPADSITQLLQPVFADQSGTKGKTPLTKGVNAGPGAASGQIVFQPDEAEKIFQQNPNVSLILVRRETTPEDLRGMKVAKGILTAFGGAASHAALVSRQMGKACVCGCGDLGDRLQGRHDQGQRQGPQGGRLDRDRRLQRRSVRRRDADRPERSPSRAVRQVARAEGRPDVQAVSPVDELGRPLPQAGSSHQRRPARPGRPGRRAGSPGCRPLPNRAHVLRPHRRLPHDDPGRDARGSREGLGQAPALSA